MIGNDWDIVLEEEYKKEYFDRIKKIVREEYSKKKIFPPANRVFYAFRETSYKDVKVGDTFQFMRQGYFCVDSDSTTDKIVFNRTVALKDSFVKKA